MNIISNVLVTATQKDTFEKNLTVAVQDVQNQGYEVEILYPGKQHGLYTALVVARYNPGL